MSDYSVSTSANGDQFSYHIVAKHVDLAEARLLAQRNLKFGRFVRIVDNRTGHLVEGHYPSQNNNDAPK